MATEKLLVNLPEINLDPERPLKDVFKQDAEWGAKVKLKPRDRMCFDCPMKDMYIEIADELLKEDFQTQDDVLKGWYCHDKTNCACRGAYNYVTKRRKRNERQEIV